MNPYRHQVDLEVQRYVRRWRWCSKPLTLSSSPSTNTGIAACPRKTVSGSTDGYGVADKFAVLPVINASFVSIRGTSASGRERTKPEKSDDGLRKAVFQIIHGE